MGYAMAASGRMQYDYKQTKTKIAFQIAFCYQIGFGVKSDGTECHRWLQKSDKQPGDLMFEKEAV
jgi:hypothetical protein